MDRNLGIAIVAGLVALILVYALIKLLRGSDFGGMIRTRDKAPIRFWMGVGYLLIAIASFGALAARKFAAWL